MRTKMALNFKTNRQVSKYTYPINIKKRIADLTINNALLYFQL